MEIDRLPETKRAILEVLKGQGGATLGELARRLGLTREAVRQQVAQLRAEGWVEPEPRAERRYGPGRAGRPATRFRLTAAGDHLFPKRYDDLAVALIDALAGELGREALERVLAAVVEERARAWEPRLRGLDLAGRVAALRDVYVEGDPYVEVETLPDGFRLVERNCPFLSVALRRPALCSVTVGLLTRLLGVRVVREERFQDGDGRCAFRVYADQPVPDPRFRLEDPA